MVKGQTDAAGERRWKAFERTAKRMRPERVFLVFGFGFDFLARGLISSLGRRGVVMGVKPRETAFRHELPLVCAHFTTIIITQPPHRQHSVPPFIRAAVSTRSSFKLGRSELCAAGLARDRVVLRRLEAPRRSWHSSGASFAREQVVIIVPERGRNATRREYSAPFDLGSFFFPFFPIYILALYSF